MSSQAELYDKFKDSLPSELEGLFIFVASQGNLDEIRYLSTTKDLKDWYADISIKNQAFLKACQFGKLDVIKFLLASPELEEHADIHTTNGKGVTLACKSGHLETVQFLLTSSELKEHANVHSENDMPFVIACQLAHFHIIKYLIFDFNIKETKRIESYLGSLIEGHNASQVEDWFKVRDLNMKLDKELPSKEVHKKGKKI